MPVHGEDHYIFDARELFQGRVNFRGNARIGADARRVGAAAEFHCGSPCLGKRAFLVKREREVWASNGPRGRAVRWATEQGIEFREVAGLLFGEGGSSD